MAVTGIAGYELLERADGNGKALYRFLHPRTPGYPQMIELLTASAALFNASHEKLLKVCGSDGVNLLISR